MHLTAAHAISSRKFYFSLLCLQIELTFSVKSNKILFFLYIYILLQFFPVLLNAITRLSLWKLYCITVSLSHVWEFYSVCSEKKNAIKFPSYLQFSSWYSRWSNFLLPSLSCSFIFFFAMKSFNICFTYISIHCGGFFLSRFFFKKKIFYFILCHLERSMKIFLSMYTSNPNDEKAFHVLKCAWIKYEREISAICLFKNFPYLVFFFFFLIDDRHSVSLWEDKIDFSHIFIAWISFLWWKMFEIFHLHMFFLFTNDSSLFLTMNLLFFQWKYNSFLKIKQISTHFMIYDGKIFLINLVSSFYLPKKNKTQEIKSSYDPRRRWLLFSY